MKAWLLTWEGEGVTDAQKLIGMYHFRRSWDFVAELVEFLYLCHTANASQMTWLANRQSKRPHKINYPLLDGPFTSDRLLCGRDPCIYARIVSELDCDTDDKRDMEILTWQEPPIWEWTDGIGSGVRRVKDGEQRRLERPARAIRRTVFES